MSFGLANSHFFDGANLLDLVRSGVTLSIVALGLTLVIISGELDLSIGAVYALAPIVLSVLWISHDLSFYVAFVIALASGLVVGLINSFFSVVTKIPSFVVTLGMFSLVSGATILIGGAEYFTPAFADPPLDRGQLSFFHGIGAAAPGGVPAQVIWLIVIGLVFVLILHRSLYGFRLSAIGGNPEAARVARLPVRSYRTVAFIICGLMAALAGLIDFSFIGSTQSTVSGSGLTFPVFAAVIIGGASLTGGSGTVIGTLSGALLLTVLSNGLSLVGVGGGWTLVFVGGITIVAVALDRWALLGPLVGEKARVLLSARRALSP
jgi:ribose/xylose/arabinose/galactoside ABC-type transport system permease subunit